MKAWVLLAVLVAEGVLGAPARAAGAALAEGPARAPVILVHGAGSGPGVWGVPDGRGRGTGLYAALLERGYVPGETLFWLDYSDQAGGDYAAVARQRLAPLVEEALARSGAARVDLVTHGMGALVARHYVTALGGSGRVRTVAMIAPPNRGSYLASLYRLAGTVADQERLRRAEGGGRGESLDPEAPYAPFVDEASYVSHVARHYFEPLYDRFVREEVFLRPADGRAAPAGFERWLAARSPEEFRAVFAAAAVPPLAEVAGEADGDPDPGRFLTRGYFHLLAVAVARNHYRRFAPWAPVLVQGWEEDVVPAEDVRTAILRFLERRALRLAMEGLRRFGPSVGRDLVLAGGQALSGLSHRSAAVARLVREREPVFPESGGADRILANHGLAGLNARDASGRSARTVRYVTVVGDVPGTGGRWGAGSGDLVVEAEAGLLPPGPLDVYRVQGGLFGNHLSLARDRRVHAFLLDQLDPLAPGALRSAPAVRRTAPSPGKGSGPAEGAAAWEGEGRGRVTPASVVLIPVPLEEVLPGRPDAREGGVPGAPGPPGAPGGGAPVLRAAVRPEGSPSPGMRLQAFFAVARGGVVRRIEPLAGGDRSGAPGGALDLGGIDLRRERVFLGVRLAPPGDDAPPLARLRAGRPQAFRFTLALAAAAGAGGAGPRADRADGAATADPAVGPAAPDGTGEADAAVAPAAGEAIQPANGAEGVYEGPETDGGDGPGPDPGQPAVRVEARDERGVPRIDVVYRNKRTTDREEDRTYHARWEWDFGDGTAWVDDDPSHVVSRVEHRFPPGRYTVRARSVSNRGTVLREMTWEVSVPAPPAPPLPGSPGTGPAGGAAARSFRAETVREAVPELVLHGPVKWVTGRPGRFRVEAKVPNVPFLESVRLTLHPAREFDVVWSRPGIFRVQAAAVVRAVYRLPEGRRLVLTNTYVVERTVDVLATSITD